MAVTYIEGTNIPTSAIAGNLKGGADYWSQRLKGSGTNINDVLFEMAYSTPFEGSTQSGSEYQGQGQGNPNVGALQSGQWRFNTGPTWAQEAVKRPDGATDIYRQRDASGKLTGAAYIGADLWGDSGGGGGGTETATGSETTYDAGDNPIVVDDPSIQTPDVASLTDEMKLSNKIQEIINTNNPLFKAATTKAMQAMAKRGLVNSSLAQGEVMNSIMAVALPIAQAEVKALTDNLYYNKDWTNKQKLQANEAAYNKMLTQIQGKINYTLQQFIEGSKFGLQQLIGRQQTGLQQLIGGQQMSMEDKVQKGRMALQKLSGKQTMALQTLLGEQNITLQNLMQDGKMALQHLSGQQRMDLQDKLGQQGIDLQTLIGEQQLTAQQREIAANAWAKYGDWIAKMASTEGADQDAWRNMLDLLKGAQGWPSLFG